VGGAEALSLGTSRWLRLPWGILGALRGWCAGHIEEALVLLVGLVQHGGEARDMFPVGVLPSLRETRVLPLPFLHQVQLFTQDVYEGVCRRL